MERHKLTADQAFGVLTRVWQEKNRKLDDIAAEVNDTGALPAGYRIGAQLRSGRLGPAGPLGDLQRTAQRPETSPAMAWTESAKESRRPR